MLDYWLWVVSTIALVLVAALPSLAYLLKTSGRKTISERIRELDKRYKLVGYLLTGTLCFAAGMVCGFLLGHWIGW